MTGRTGKVTALVLFAALLCSLLAVGAGAENEPMHKLPVYQAAQLQEALDQAAEMDAPATVTLMEDCTLELTQKRENEAGDELLAALTLSAGTVTLDLNGHTIRAAEHDTVLAIDSGASLTVTDSSESGDGKIVGGCAVVYAFSSTFTLNGGTLCVDAAQDVVHVYGIYGEDAQITVDGGAIELTGQEAEEAAVAGINAYGGTVSLSGGTITVDTGAAIDGFGYGVANQNGCITLKECTISATARQGSYVIGVAGQNSDVVIHGGTITAKAEEGADYADAVGFYAEDSSKTLMIYGGEMIAAGDALYVDPTDCNVAIYGGYFRGVVDMPY